MGRVKETQDWTNEMDERDLLALQHQNAKAALEILELYLDDLAWRVQFFSERLTPEQLEHIRGEIRTIGRIIL